MSDTIKQIREAIEARILGLPDGFTKLDNKFKLEKNNFTNQDKKFGVFAADGTSSDFLVNKITIDRVFRIVLCNKFISTNNEDEKQELSGDTLESLMEDAISDLSKSRLGLSSLVLSSDFIDNEEIDYEEIENLAILRFNINVKFRKGIC